MAAGLTGWKPVPLVWRRGDGGGKTYILKWLEREELPSRRIEPFYFDNPGVQFYELANALLRQIGRKDFAKMLWELAGAHVSGFQRSLFARGYQEFLDAYSKRRAADVAGELQRAIKEASIAQDDEIAHRLARIVTEIPKKPYFEYRDFVAGRRDSLVAEGEEAGYFSAILRTLRVGKGITAAAFLVDEFEEVSLQKRLSRREAHDYLATMRRLISLTEQEGLWLIVGMTPDAVEKTQELEPALWQRFTSQGEYLHMIDELSADEANGLVRARLDSARGKPRGLYPFPDDLGQILSKTTTSNPRRLVQVCFRAISEANGQPLPFGPEHVTDVERKLFPPAKEVDMP